MHAVKFPDGVEVRAAVEIRAAGRKLEGHAAVWDSPATIGQFTEVIRRGAFTASLAAGKDILALVDHDPSKLLGRTRSGTLRVSEDSKGLAFQVDLPTTALANDVLALVDRGDVGGMSFGFRVPAGGDHWPSADRRELRTVDLLELSLVHSWPAYGDTTVMARSRLLAGPEAVAALARRRMLESL